MSVAFGQKGRWEMRLFELPTLALSLFGLGLLSGFDAAPAHADFTFGEPVNLGAPVNTSSADGSPCISPDGLEMYIFSTRPGGYGSSDVWVTRRASLEDDWGTPVNAGPQVNSTGMDNSGSISADGLTLYFSSNRPGAYGYEDIYTATRPTREASWGPAVNLGPLVNSWAGDDMVMMSADGLELFFDSGRPGGFGMRDIWVSTRASVADPWGPAMNLGPTINSPYQDLMGCLSPDGLRLFFNSARPGGFGDIDIWMATRPFKGAPWTTPVNLGPSVNTSDCEWVFGISPDGRTLYFDDDLRARPGTLGTSDIYQVPIIPIVDFNGDGKVDGKEVLAMAEHWGQNESLCDIGPFPWGDGVVDEKDLNVLMESMITPGPHASDVPCDVILSWISPSFAPTCDVYFGTSFTDVNSADRADPCGVLVSQGQTATTYDPEGLLELAKTYYWRIDFVSAEPNPVIYRGSVWQFTTEAAIYPIRSLTATASSFQPGMEPEKTIDRSGLDANDLHSTDSKDMWWSKPEALHWIQYQFDRVYRLHEMWVWNYNLPIEPSVGFGAKTVKIEHSTDGTAWTPLDGVAEFARAPGQSGYAPNTTVSFGGVSAKFVKLTIAENWGVTQQTGLSEVRFYAMSAAAAAKP
jgi:hypothetical protein